MPTASRTPVKVSGSAAGTTRADTATAPFPAHGPRRLAYGGAATASAVASHDGQRGERSSQTFGASLIPSQMTSR